MSYCRHIAGVGTIAVVLALTGCGQEDSAEKPGTTAASQPSAAAPVTTTIQNFAPAPAGGHGVPVSAALQALQTAAQAVPNGRPFDLEVETDSGHRVFDIKVASNGNEVKVVVNEDGTQIVWQNQASTPDDDVAKVDAAQSKPVGQCKRPLNTSRMSRYRRWRSTQIEMVSSCGKSNWCALTVPKLRSMSTRTAAPSPVPVDASIWVRNEAFRETNRVGIAVRQFREPEVSARSQVARSAFSVRYCLTPSR